MITYFLPRDGELHILHPSIVHLFRSYRFLLSLLFYQFLDSFGSIQEISGYAPASVRSEWMDERRGKEGGKRKNSRAWYPVPFDASTCRIRFTRGMSILLCVASRTQSSPLAIPSRFSNHRIIYPSCNKRSIPTAGHGFLFTEIFGSSVKIVDKPVTLRSLSENKFGGKNEEGGWKGGRERREGKKKRERIEE